MNVKVRQKTDLSLLKLRLLFRIKKPTFRKGPFPIYRPLIICHTHNFTQDLFYIFRQQSNSKFYKYLQHILLHKLKNLK